MIVEKDIDFAGESVSVAGSVDAADVFSIHGDHYFS